MHITLHDLAAACTFAIARNNLFVDGNKRTAADKNGKSDADIWSRFAVHETGQSAGSRIPLVLFRVKELLMKLLRSLRVVMAAILLSLNSIIHVAPLLLGALINAIMRVRPVPTLCERVLMAIVPIWPAWTLLQHERPVQNSVVTGGHRQFCEGYAFSRQQTCSTTIAVSAPAQTQGWRYRAGAGCHE